jgi:hypothetical protein
MHRIPFDSQGVEQKGNRKAYQNQAQKIISLYLCLNYGDLMFSAAFFINK